MTENAQIIYDLLVQLYNKSLANPDAPFVQIPGASFVLNYDDPIIDLPSRPAPRKYQIRELLWYLSQDRCINPIVGNVKTWQNVSSDDDMINSNYGYLVFSKENGLQLYHAVMSLIDNKDSRQAICIYQRPSMHEDSKANGMSDFVCTLATQFIIDNDRLEVMHNMRSNDCIYGFVSDFYWVSTLSNLVFSMLKPIYPNLQRGKLHWTANSFHLYKMHYDKCAEIIKAAQAEGVQNESKY